VRDHFVVNKLVFIRNHSFSVQKKEAADSVRVIDVNLLKLRLLGVEVSFHLKTCGKSVMKKLFDHPTVDVHTAP
jgi:hypothetical protein